MPMQTPAPLRGDTSYQEPLSRHTSWRVGGPAKLFYRPADRDDLIAFLRQLPADEPLLWLGHGSNLLVRDGGFQGTVIATRGRLGVLERLPDGLVRAEAGVSCAAVSRFVNRQGLIGVEFLAGIPGTIGGALAMNAGAFGGETWERVVYAETLDRYGVVRKRGREAFDIGYRRVHGAEGEWFLAVCLQADEGDAEAGQERIRALLDQRNQTQPIGLPSCGSVFRNPPNDHAARLIEAAGLKGETIGGAAVSMKHANFIINTGDASASDIEQLIERVRARVEVASGVRLVCEVHLVGDAESGR